jgi:hypothetical protein
LKTVVLIGGNMNSDRERLIKNLSELPEQLLAAVTLRAAMRYLPMFAIGQDPNGAMSAVSPPNGGSRAPRTSRLISWFAKRSIPLVSWLARRSIEKQTIVAKHLHDTVKIFGAFHTCQASLFVNWFVSSSVDKDIIIADGPHHAANVTHAAVCLVIAEEVSLSSRAIAAAAGSAAGDATSAALDAAGAPMPGIPAEAGAKAVPAAIDVAEYTVNAVELAADIGSLRLGNAGLSADKIDPRQLTEATVRLLSAPLWPRGMPLEVELTWRTLRGKMFELNAGFEIWIEWYEKRLWGVPLNMSLEENWATLSEAWLSLDPADINAYLQPLVRGEPRKEPEPALVAAAARKKEKATRPTIVLPELKYNLKSLNHLLWRAEDWRKATLEQFRLPALPTLFFATFGAISFISKSFEIPIYGPKATSALLTYEWLGTGIFAPIAVLIGFVGIVTPFWCKDLFFVYVRVTGSVWRALSTCSSGPPDRPSIFRRNDWSRLIAISWASLLWPYHFLAFRQHWLEPVKTYYNTNPPVFDILKRGDTQGISSSVMLALFIPHFAVNILTIVLFTSAYFAINAYLAP